MGRSHCLKERRCSELRVSGRTISGTVVEYGDVADMGAFRERFEVGAFGDVSQLDTTLNILHRQDRLVGRTGGGGVVFRDTPGALLMSATMPATRDGDDALELVRSGVLRGLSVEFRAIRDRFVGDLREIGRAVLDGLGLVDRPAYAGSVGLEVRQDDDLDAADADDAELETEFQYNRQRVTASRGSSRKGSVRPGAFAFVLGEEEQRQERGGDREVSLVLGDYQHPLASRLAGSLVLEDTPRALIARVCRLPDTSYVRDFRAAYEARSINPGVDVLYQVPPEDVVPNAVELVPEPGNEDVLIEVVNHAVLTAIRVVNRAPRGNPGRVTLRRVPGRAPPQPTQSRRRLWGYL